MANERMYPILPCRDVDDAIAFYAALGFKKTYRQLKPNPYAVVARDDMHVHLFGMDNFNPADSYGSVVIAVPDPDALYRSFADGLRAAYKKLPVAGIPRILRPRKKLGTVYGFSVVDVGGNWLRISKLGEQDAEEDQEPPESKDLAYYLDLAARLGDAHGDDRKAFKSLDTGLKRFPDAAPIDRARALLFYAELAVRLSELDVARTSLATIATLALSDDERAGLGDELAHVTSLLAAANN